MVIHCFECNLTPVFLKDYSTSILYWQCCKCQLVDTWFMVFSATFNNISVILWWLVLLVEETGVPRENHWSVTSHWQTLSHIKLCRVHLIWAGFELTTLVVIGTDCVASYKSNYHMITATMTPIILASEKCQKSQVCKDPFSWSSRSFYFFIESNMCIYLYELSSKYFCLSRNQRWQFKESW